MAGYRAFIAQGIEGETRARYHRGQGPAVIGGDAFKAWRCEEKLPAWGAGKRVARLSPKLALTAVTAKVAQVYREPESELRAVRRGARPGVKSRKVAMVLCQRAAASVSFLRQIKHMRAGNRGLDKRIEAIAKNLLEQDT